MALPVHHEWIAHKCNEYDLGMELTFLTGTHDEFMFYRYYLSTFVWAEEEEIMALPVHHEWKAHKCNKYDLGMELTVLTGTHDEFMFYRYYLSTFVWAEEEDDE